MNAKYCPCFFVNFIFSNRTVEVRGAPKVLPVKAAGFFASPQLTCSLTHLMYFLSKCTCARNKAAVPAACTISEEMVISSSLIPPTLPWRSPASLLIAARPFMSEINPDKISLTGFGTLCPVFKSKESRTCVNSFCRSPESSGISPHSSKIVLHVD